MTATSATDQFADHPLMRLRAALDAQGLTGFLIPKADKHQGEYTPARDERLAWATGFTGSAGLAAVVGEKTALFVDGRYEIQAAEQVPTALVDVVAIRERTPEDWLRQTVSPGARIGFDPWLHTEAQIEKLAEAVEAAGGTLEALDANPIDALWNDRPPAPASAARRHDEAFAGKSAKDKRTDVAATLASENLAAAVLTLPDSIA